MTDDGREDTGMINAMGVWGRKLAGFADRPEVLAAVLEHLPEAPPSLPEFVARCREEALRINGGAPRLPHRMTPEERERADQAARAAEKAIDRAGCDPLAWAKRPRSEAALDAVIEAAPAHKGLQKVLDTLTAEGIAGEGGVLLRRYCGMEQWETLRAARARPETEEVPA
jgi:hypothetical protein